MLDISHLQGLSPAFKEMADVELRWDGDTSEEARYFLLHSQILSLKSGFFAELISINRSASTDDGSPMTTSVLSNLPDTVQRSPYCSRFLQHLYIDTPKFANIDEAEGVLLLANFFGAPCSAMEMYLCISAAQALQSNQPLDVATLCRLLRTATHYKLQELAALILPWAIQRLSIGPLLDPVFPIWSEAQDYLNQLGDALDETLKLVTIETQWWTSSVSTRCTICGCLNSELALVLHPSYMPRTMGCTVGGQPIRPPLPAAYLAAARHVAHILANRGYGCNDWENHRFFRNFRFDAGAFPKINNEYQRTSL